jgi:hypothetical protein
MENYDMSKTLKFGIVLLVILCGVLGAVLLIDIPKNGPALSQAINTETPSSIDQDPPPPDVLVSVLIESLNLFLFQINLYHAG